MFQALFVPLLGRVQTLLFNGLCTYQQATCEQYLIQYTETATAQELLINSRP